jgi:hypothetical protein
MARRLGTPFLRLVAGLSDTIGSSGGLRIFRVTCHVEDHVIFGQSKQGEPMASPRRFPPPWSYVSRLLENAAAQKRALLDCFSVMLVKWWRGTEERFGAFFAAAQLSANPPRWFAESDEPSTR